MKRFIILLTGLFLITGLITAQETNNDLNKARECYQKGINLMHSNQLEPAKNCLTTAARIYKNVNKTNYAIINIALADVYIKTSKPDSAKTLLYGAKKIITSTKGDTNKYIASIYNKLGQIFFEENRLDSAAYYWKNALNIAIATTGGNSELTAGIYGNIGNLYARKENYSLAEKYFMRSMQIYSDLYTENCPQVAYTQLNLANIYKSQGKYDQALELLQKSLKTFETIFGKNSSHVAKTLKEIGDLYIETEQYELAKEYMQRALDINSLIFGPYSIQVADVYYSLGLIYKDMKDYEKALQFYTAALKIYQKYLPPNNENILGLRNNIAIIYRNLGNYEMAAKYYKETISSLKSINPDDYRIPLIYTNIAAIFYTNNQTDSAIKYYNLSIDKLSKKYGIHNPNLIKPYLNLSYVYLKNNEYGKALEYIQKSIIANYPDFNDTNITANPVSGNFFNGTKLLESYSNKAAAFIELYKKTNDTTYLSLAYKISILADKLITETRQTIAAEEDKLNFNLHTVKVYENAIFVCNSLAKIHPDKKWQYLNKAFYFAERNKAGLLVEAMNAAKAQKVAGIPDSLIEREAFLRNKIAFYEDKLNSINDLNTERLYREKLFDLKNQYRALVSHFETFYPKYYELKYAPNFVSIQTLQEFLKPNQAILSYFYGYLNLYTFFISKDTFYIATSAVDKIADTLVFLRKNITMNTDQAKRNYTESAFALYKMVFPYYVPDNISQLIIIPDDILNILPFEALLSKPVSENDFGNFKNYPFLIKLYSISYSYSSYLFYQLHKDNAQSINGYDFLGVAPGFLHNNAPVFNGKPVPPLPGSIEEVRTIATNFEDKGLYSKILIDTAATETRFKHLNLDAYKIIHISTHGLIFSSQPEKSALIFSKENYPDDGFLHPGEIYTLKTSASLITLSACETGLGKISKGEGVIGMSRAFFYAGAQNMIISLWQVSDKATKDLMIKFYENLLNQMQNIDENTRYNVPLRAAKLWMINNGYAHPYFWSSFILIGE